MSVDQTQSGRTCWYRGGKLCRATYGGQAAHRKLGEVGDSCSREGGITAHARKGTTGSGTWKPPGGADARSKWPCG